MKKPHQISFRLTEEQAHQLDQRRGRHSRGECARRLVLTGLEGQDAKYSRHLAKTVARLRRELEEQSADQATAAADTNRQIEMLIGRISRLREDLGMALSGILTRLGRTVSDEEAEHFVHQTLLYDQPEATGKQQ